MIIAWMDWEEMDRPRDLEGRPGGRSGPSRAAAAALPGDSVDHILQRLFRPLPGYSPRQWQSHVVAELTRAARCAVPDNPRMAASLRHLAALRAAHDEPYRDVTPTAADGRRYDWQSRLIQDAAPRLVAEGPVGDHGRAA
jgi:hypothetical protein